MNYPNIESSLAFFVTEPVEYSEIFEGIKIMARLNKNFTNEIIKYSVYFLNIWVGIDEFHI